MSPLHVDSAHSDDYNHVFDVPENAMTKFRTYEKEYRINDNGRVLKRSLREDEYLLLGNGDWLIPLLVKERLCNEAACLEYIRKNTSIPVPKVLDLHEENGSYYLWTEYIHGVTMSELSEEDKVKVYPQGKQALVETSEQNFNIHQSKALSRFLQTHSSRLSGGPTGLLSPPTAVYFYHMAQWEQKYASNEEFVLCHGDMSQLNILVDRETLKIVGVIDWEYAGFFPREHEIPFLLVSQGIRILPNYYSSVDGIIKFWEQSQKPVSQ